MKLATHPTQDWQTTAGALAHGHGRVPASGQSRPQVKSGRRVAKQHIADVTAQLAIMSRSGVDLASALQSLASQCQRPQLEEVLRDVHQSVLSGHKLSDALRRHEDIFGGAFIATVGAGEASGEMATVLSELADLQRAEIRLSRTVKAMLTYPVLLTVVSSGVIAALVVFVLPQFAKIFADYEMSLPAATQLLIDFAAELRLRWWLWLPAVGAAIAGLLAWTLTITGRQYRDRFAIHAPIVGSVVRPMLTGRICRMIGLMLSSGVPLLEGLGLAQNAVGNYLFKDLLADMQEAVVNGSDLASVLSTNELVPQSAREMIITAERTGNLGEVTQLLGTYYEEEAEARIRQVIRVFEPFITVVMGAIVAFVVLAVMLPIFDLSKVAQH